MTQTEIINAILAERKRQDSLHPSNKLEEYPAILLEEVGEVGAALQNDGVLKDELIQVASVCVRWLENI